MPPLGAATLSKPFECTSKSTNSMPLTILNCCIKSPRSRRVSRLVRSSRSHLSSYGKSRRLRGIRVTRRCARSSSAISPRWCGFHAGAANSRCGRMVAVYSFFHKLGALDLNDFFNIPVIRLALPTALVTCSCDFISGVKMMPRSRSLVVTSRV